MKLSETIKANSKDIKRNYKQNITERDEVLRAAGITLTPTKERFINHRTERAIRVCREYDIKQDLTEPQIRQLYSEILL